MNINLTGAVNFRSYGLVTTNFLKSLAKLGHFVSLWPLPMWAQQYIEAEPQNHSLVNDALKRSETYDWNSPSVRVWHQFALAQHVGKGKRVGYTIFELDRLKPTERHQLMAQDLILVPSEWARKIVRQENIHVPCKAVPLGYDPEIFCPARPEKNDKTIFFNAGKWEVRKGHDILVDIFNKAFSPKDNVELWMMPHNPFLSEQQTKEWERLYHNSTLGNKIFILSWRKTQQEVADIMKKADFGIFPSRAEGFGLESLEMAACGKPVIISNCTAHQEYAKGDGFHLVDMPGKESSYDGIWFNGEGNWHEIDDNAVEQFVHYMRLCHEQKQNGHEILLPNVSQFTWGIAAQRLVDAIS